MTPNPFTERLFSLRNKFVHVWERKKLVVADILRCNECTLSVHLQGLWPLVGSTKRDNVVHFMEFMEFMRYGDRTILGH